MVLQRLEGCSDREACDRFAYDLRWRYAAGVDDEMPGFVHTVLVELRARLRASANPDRIFRVTCELARQAGLVGVRRVLDSAPLFDAVATQDTVTLLRGAIRGVLRACSPELAVVVRSALARDDDYVAAGKPVCDWDDLQAREQLVDALFRDGYRALGALRGRMLGPEVAQAAELLAAVIGQDIEETADGRFIIAQGTAPDRVISVVDPQARHGHKSNARGFDGYKGHVAIDPDSEVVTAAEVGPANAGDAAMAPALLADLAVADGDPPPDQATTNQAPVVYGDAAYGTGALLAELDQRGITAMTKVAAPTAPAGHSTKQQFRIDLEAGRVTCPARLQVPIIPARAAAVGWLASAVPAPCARWRRPAPAAEPAAPSPSTRRRPGSRRPEPGSGSRPGGPTTALTGRRSSASWRICCAAATAAAAPACGAGCGLPRTGGCWPPRSTWPASPPSECAQDRAGGSWLPPEPEETEPTGTDRRPDPFGAAVALMTLQRPPSPTRREGHWPPRS
jgi:Transposase DDE domain/Transposase domain (DUF772)